MSIVLVIAAILCTSGAMAYIMLRLSLRTQVAKCAACQQSLPRCLIDGAGLCPLCTRDNLEGSAREVGANQSPLCHRCGNTDIVHELWDGHCYCNACLGSDEPAALKAALCRDGYNEVMHLPWKRVLCRHVVELLGLWGIGVIMLGIVMLVLSRDTQAAVKVAGFFTVVGSPIAFVIAGGRTVLCCAHPVQVIVGRGQIGVVDAVRAQAVAIQGCCWREGRVGESSFGQVPRSAKSHCIILSAETASVEGTRDRVQIAVGMTAESRAVWGYFTRIIGLSPCETVT